MSAQVFLDNLRLIEEIISSVYHRHAWPAAELEDFAASAKLHLIENDYAALRRFQGRSSLRTYLTRIIHRHLLDGRVASWGKWRPSAAARRQGKLAVQLETLLHRDGQDHEQARLRLQQRFRTAISRDDLEQLAARLPERAPRRPPAVPHQAETAGSESADQGLWRANREHSLRSALAALAAAVAALPAQDRLILTLRFRDAFSVAEVAAELGLQVRPLYRRVQLVLTALRRQLEAEGHHAADVAAALGDPWLEPEAAVFRVAGAAARHARSA
jgi:RNA polymerase sigma factor for flagellar operon FliA